MPIDIVVKRVNSVPYKHEDVTDPLICDSLACALSRGASILDSEGSGNQMIDLQTEFVEGLTLGTVVEIRDSYTSLVWKGKLVSIQHDCTNDGEGLIIDTTLRIEKPTMFYSLEST